MKRNVVQLQPLTNFEITLIAAGNECRCWCKVEFLGVSMLQFELGFRTKPEVCKVACKARQLKFDSCFNGVKNLNQL